MVSFTPTFFRRDMANIRLYRALRDFVGPDSHRAPEIADQRPYAL